MLSKKKFSRIWLEPRSQWVNSWVATTIQIETEEEWHQSYITLSLSDCGNKPVNIEFGYMNEKDRKKMRTKLNRLQSAVDKIRKALEDDDQQYPGDVNIRR